MAFLPSGEQLGQNRPEQFHLRSTTAADVSQMWNRDRSRLLKPKIVSQAKADDEHDWKKSYIASHNPDMPVVPLRDESGLMTPQGWLMVKLGASEKGITSASNEKQWKLSQKDKDEALDDDINRRSDLVEAADIAVSKALTIPLAQSILARKASTVLQAHWDPLTVVDGKWKEIRVNLMEEFLGVLTDPTIKYGPNVVDMLSFAKTLEGYTPEQWTELQNKVLAKPDMIERSPVGMFNRMPGFSRPSDPAEDAFPAIRQAAAIAMRRALGKSRGEFNKDRSAQTTLNYIGVAAQEIAFQKALPAQADLVRQTLGVSYPTQSSSTATIK